MKLTPLAPRDPVALRDALVRRGVDGARACAVAEGARPVAFIVEDITRDTQEALLEAASRAGAECMMGDGWVLLAGAVSRVAGIAKSGPSGLCADVAEAIGVHLAGGEERSVWVTARGPVDLSRPVVVGVLNITPDSFSDGGDFLDPAAAMRHAEAMIESGADMLDLGAESSRPGCPNRVPPDEEWRRLAPVLTELARSWPSVPLSVDTVKAVTAARALDHGAWIVNDVSGLRLDSALARVCAEHGAGIVLMHSRGDFQTMATYDHAFYGDVVGETVQELAAAVELALDSGLTRDRIVVDPGLGFAKDPDQCYTVIRGLPVIRSLGFPVMIGPSRKRFLGAATGGDVAHRDDATANVCVAALLLGATLFRVHAVDRARQALALAAAIRSN